MQLSEQICVCNQHYSKSANSRLKENSFSSGEKIYQFDTLSGTNAARECTSNNW